MRIALYQPDIPQNTGTILRLAACMNVAVDVIGPAGFDMSDRALRRSSLDYLDQVSLQRHESWAEFVTSHGQVDPPPRLILLSTKGKTRHTDFKFNKTDTLLFGRESAGVPDNVHAAVNHCIRIPMKSGLRSLNVAVAVAMTLGEALRQTDGFA